jgi:hypothetical protein
MEAASRDLGGLSLDPSSIEYPRRIAVPTVPKGPGAVQHWPLHAGDLLGTRSRVAGWCRTRVQDRGCRTTARGGGETPGETRAGGATVRWACRGAMLPLHHRAGAHGGPTGPGDWRGIGHFPSAIARSAGGSRRGTRLVQAVLFVVIGLSMYSIYARRSTPASTSAVGSKHRNRFHGRKTLGAEVGACEGLHALHNAAQCLQ